jgi:hypothetical protein
MFVLGSTVISPDRAFTHPESGVQYPSNWLRLASPAEREAIGIRELPDPPQWDQRFYWGYDDDGQLILKDHGQLVEQWTATTRATANTLLQPTDWIIIREADNGKAADPALKQWREGIRQASGVKIATIAATADTPELAAYITGTEYPVWPADPYAPVPDGDAGTADPDGMVLDFNGGSTGAAILTSPTII